MRQGDLKFVHDGGVSPESWESLDGVDLADTFLQRVLFFS